MIEARLLNTLRALLGIMLIFWGINLMTQLVPIPPMQEEARMFFSAMRESGYFIPLVSVFILGTGVCLILNRLVSISLVILAPISINIFLFYLVLDPAGLGGGIILVVLNGLLLLKNRRHYSSILGNKPPILTHEPELSKLINQE